MKAVRLHGPCDLRVEDLPEPPAPGRGEVLVKVSATGICGSDLHTYLDGRIGDTPLRAPLILGHECAGMIEACGPEPLDMNGGRLIPGMRVAIDPATPCGSCEMCLQNEPHLCTELRFLGLSPEDGCLRERMRIPARSCFPLPETVDDTLGALLEPLGVGIHAVRLAKLKRGTTAALLGAGPLGLIILQLARLAGAQRVFVSEPLSWRLALAERLGGIPIGHGNPAPIILDTTGGRGADVTFEVAWAGETVQQAAEITKPGGRIVLVGIPRDDHVNMRHSTGRRKGLTFLYSRRMKHTYPEALRLVVSKHVDLECLVSHRFPLEKAPEAFSLNAEYQNNVVKVILGA